MRMSWSSRSSVRNPFALVFASGGTAIRVVKMDTFTPAPYTVLGWMVKDIEAEARALTARGVRFVRYPPMEQSELGIWTAPDGSRVAWFRDPSENVLSLAQHSRPGER